MVRDEIDGIFFIGHNVRYHAVSTKRQNCLKLQKRRLASFIVPLNLELERHS